MHISHLSDTFIKDPRDAVKTGDIVTVKVLEIDVERKRIALSMKTSIETNTNTETKPERQLPKTPPKAKVQPAVQGSMANAFAKALNK